MLCSLGKAQDESSTYDIPLILQALRVAVRNRSGVVANQSIFFAKERQFFFSHPGKCPQYDTGANESIFFEK